MTQRERISLGIVLVCVVLAIGSTAPRSGPVRPMPPKPGPKPGPKPPQPGPTPGPTPGPVVPQPQPQPDPPKPQPEQPQPPQPPQPGEPKSAEQIELETKLKALCRRKYGSDGIEAQRRMFDEYDADHSGELSWDETNRLLSDADVGNVLTRGAWLTAIFHKLDKNYSDGISWSEYQAAAGQSTPAPSPTPSPTPAADPEGWVPYLPTPVKVRDRALELLQTMSLGETRHEDDPAGIYGEIEFRCRVHPPSSEINVPHKGVDVWRRATPPRP